MSHWRGSVLPFFHVFGLSSVINVFVRYGGCLSILPRFQPTAVMNWLLAPGAAAGHDRGPGPSGES